MAGLVGRFSLPLALLQQLEQEARRQRRPVSWLVRDALLAYLPCPDAPKAKQGRIDWRAIEKWVVTTPGATLRDAAKEFEVSERAVYSHGGWGGGKWLDKQKAYFRRVAAECDSRLSEILAQDRGDDAKALLEIQMRLQRAALQLLERLFPPADAPVEIHIEAQKLVAGLSGRDVLRAVTDISRTLTKTGRHLRQLAGKSTDIYERVGMPSIDVYIPATLEDAKRAELMGRAAQQALKAAVAGQPIDVEGSAVSPAGAYPTVTVTPRQQVSPTRLDVGL